MAYNHDVELTNRAKGSVQDGTPEPEEKESHVRSGMETGPLHKLDVHSASSHHQAWLIIEQRYINFLPTLAFGANLLATWEAISVSFQAGLLNGGPVRKLQRFAPPFTLTTT